MRIEAAATAAGLSVNAWLVRVAALAAEGARSDTPRRARLPRRSALQGMGSLAMNAMTTNKTERNECRRSTHPSPFRFTSSLVESASSGLSRATGRTPPSRCVLPILRARRTSRPLSGPESSTPTVSLTVKGPKGWRYYSGWGEWRESIDVEIAMPAGSRFEGKAGMGTLHCEGQLDELRFKTGAGEIHAEQTGSVTVRTGFGNVNIERAAGRAEISTGSGRLEVGRVDGSAAVRNSNGDTWIGDVGGRAPGERRERQDRGRPAAVGGLRQNGERRHRARCSRER